MGGNDRTVQLNSFPVEVREYLGSGRCVARNSNHEDWRCELEKKNCFLPDDESSNGEEWIPGKSVDKIKDDFACSCGNTMVGACWQKDNVSSAPAFRCAAHSGMCDNKTEIFGDLSGENLKLEDHCYCGINAKLPTYYGACRTWSAIEIGTEHASNTDHYCAYREEDCPSNTHGWLNPIAVANTLGEECPCHRVRIGACLRQSEGSSKASRDHYCAVTPDDCVSGYSFVDPMTLIKEYERSCNLCPPPEGMSPPYDEVDKIRHDELSEGIAAFVAIGSVVGIILIGIVSFFCVQICRNKTPSSSATGNEVI